MSAPPPTRYYAWAPGAWLARSTTPADDSFVDVSEVVCAYCGEVRALPYVDPDSDDLDEEEEEEFRRATRAHWESHIAPVAEPVEFFHLPGAGNVKSRDTGSWAAILLSVPYLLMDGDRLPPPGIIRAVLATGENLAGMSGGSEWPRVDLTDDEVLAIQGDLLQSGRFIDEPPPSWVSDASSYAAWKRPGTLAYVTGDATVPQDWRPKVIVHVCNDLGGWGRGFVTALSRRWSQPEAAYRSWYRSRDANDFGLGSVQLVQVEDDVWVANLIGQHDIRRGPDGSPPVRYDAIETGLRNVARLAAERSASVHMPRIGCGLAGGEWSMIEPMIAKSLLENGVSVTVYDLP